MITRLLLSTFLISCAVDPAVDSTTEAVQRRTQIGMSAPTDEWAQRLHQTGPVYARRIFGDLDSPQSAVSLAASEIAAGRFPILSFKVPNDNDWIGAAHGRYDTQLVALKNQLAALGGRVFVTLHHEPSGDGTAADYAAMQAHVLPILSPPSNVLAGVIVNGFWWSDHGQRLTDAEIAQWLPASVLAKAEVVAADCYQGGTFDSPGEDAGVKIANLSAWATRVGVNRLGIGEYNGMTAAAITHAGDAILADSRFVFAAIFNSSRNNRPGVDWVLSGTRLAAFIATVTDSRD